MAGLVPYNASNEEDGTGYVVAEFGGQFFGFPTLEIQDVVQLTRLTHVPLAAGFVRGISNMRGRIVTIVDAAEYLGLVSQSPDHCVTCQINNDLCGFLVDKVDKVISVSPKKMDPIPFTVSEKLKQVSSGVTREGKDLIILLDVNKMLGNLVPSNTEDDLF